MTDVPDGNYWTDAREVDGQPEPLLEGTRILFTFQSGRITAHAGCNTMTGAYELVDSHLYCGPLAQTLMAGPEPVMAQERWLAGLLDQHPVVNVTGDDLTLRSDGQMLVLRREERPASSLAGTMWRLRQVRDRAGRVVVDTDVLRRFRADLLLANRGGVMSVQTGCNLGQAGVQVGATTIQVGPMRLTRRACHPDAAPVEAAMLAVLSGTVDVTLATDRLELSRAGEDRVLVLHAEPPGRNVPPSTADRSTPAPG